MGIIEIGEFKDSGDLRDIWDRMPSYSWEDFIQAIKEFRAEKGDSELFSRTEKKASEALAEDKQFPDSPIQLAAFLGGREAENDRE